MSANGAKYADLVRSILLAEPLTVKGRKSLIALQEFGFNSTLSEKEFLKNIYSEPFAKPENLASEVIPFQTDSDADPDYPYTQMIDRNNLNLEKDKFENSLKKLSNSLFVIKGATGSGKTTYIHHLKEEITSIEFLISNFEETVRTIDLLGKRFDFRRKYDKNVWKFISTILEIISSILKENNKYYTGEHLDYIKQIVEIYKLDIDRIGKDEGWPDDSCFVDVFEILELYVKSAIDVEQLAQEINTHFMSRYDEFEHEKDQQYGQQEAIKLTIGFLIRLFYCLSRINKKKYICVIDNIEAIVPFFDEDHPIRDCGLQNILDGIVAAINNIRPLLPINMPGYKTFYGFILVTRENTANIVRISQYEDYNLENEVDMSEWFRARDIFEKKITYFRTKSTIPMNSPYVTAYEHITNDLSLSRWHMHGFITRMYNNNLRRIAENLISAISVIPEAEIENFNTQWEKTLKSDKDYNHLKHLCRQFVIRILLDHAQRSNYFDQVKAEGSKMPKDRQRVELLPPGPSFGDENIQKEEESVSYARRVATLLHRVAVSKQHRNDYLSFTRLINTLLVPQNHPYINPSETQLRDLASILYWMNETRHVTNWAALVTIKFDSSHVYNENTLYEVMKKEWDLYSSGLSDKANLRQDIDRSREYGVRITKAGSLFAKIVPEFEYFSCRFLFCEPALMALENLKTIKIKDKDTFRAIAIIKETRKRAFKHIDEAIEIDKAYYSLPGMFSAIDPYKSMYNQSEIYSWTYKEQAVDRAIVHPLRVLHQHMGYVYHYIKYIENDLEMHNFGNQSDKEKIVKLAKDELTEYWEKLYAVTKENPQYFNSYKPKKDNWGL
ncbi:MAG: hypothetical protein LBB91_03265 [Clostridiales bacterium]|jgi:small-conductance mechanosensitive channel|nr:hypothetical protein [Clostridiales bacterium]